MDASIRSNVQSGQIIVGAQPSLVSPVTVRSTTDQKIQALVEQRGLLEQELTTITQLRERLGNNGRLEMAVGSDLAPVIQTRMDEKIHQLRDSLSVINLKIKRLARELAVSTPTTETKSDTPALTSREQIKTRTQELHKEFRELSSKPSLTMQDQARLQAISIEAKALLERDGALEQKTNSHRPSLSRSEKAGQLRGLHQMRMGPSTETDLLKAKVAIKLGVATENVDEVVADFAKKNGITDEIVARESAFLGMDPQAAKLNIVLRYKALEAAGLDPSISKGSLAERQRVTGYPKELILSIESNPLQLAQKTGNELVNGYVINRFQHEGKPLVIIHEAVYGEGSFKEARAASNYFNIRSGLDRGKLADIRPKEQNQLAPTHRLSNLFAVWQKEGKQEQFQNVTRDSVLLPNASETDTSSVSDTESNASSSTATSNQSSNVNQTAVFPADQVSQEGSVVEGTFVQGTFVQGTFVQGTIVRDGNNESGGQADFAQFANRTLGNRAVADEQPEAESLPMAPSYKEEVEYEVRFSGNPGFVDQFIVLNADTDSPIMLKEAAGFRLDGLRLDNETIREPCTAVSLEDALTAMGSGMTEAECGIIVNFFFQAAQALETMHKDNLINNDIKPANFIISPDGKVALTDFGTVCKPKEKPNAQVMGTPLFLSPEGNLGIATPKTDVWSFGISLQCLLMCTSSENFPTFEALQIPEDGNVRMRMQALVRNKRIQDEYNTNFPEPDKTTDPLLYLCWWTTRFNPSERPTMQEVSQFLMKNHGKIVEEIKRRSICN